MARIAVGGWQHETNTFATIRADYAAFERQDDWPPLCTGENLFVETRGVHLPISGAVEALRGHGHDLVPLLWASATPSAHVTEDAFERIAGQLLAALEQALSVDGVYLDLHGAMVCEHLEDGEGELLKRVRALVGDQVPVMVSLDLHANITPQMVEHATLLDVFRTYPHVDMGETGARTATLLDRMLVSGESYFSAFRQIDFVVELTTGCSLIEPCKSIYGDLPQLIGDEVVAASFACGFPLSDIYHMGPSVLAYGLTAEAADVAADRLRDLINLNRDRFNQKIWPAAEGVKKAGALIARGAGTVVLADTQDNPGGGGSGDTTGLLQVLVEQSVRIALFGALADPTAAATAHRVGVGNTFEALLGGHSGLPGQQPWPCRCEVLALGDGNFTATGPMYRGARMQLGPCALVDIGGVHVVLVSTAVQVADQEILRHVGAEPATYQIVAIKSSVHFRNDFTALADEILVVAAPGAVFADPAGIDYQRVRPDLSVRDT